MVSIKVRVGQTLADIAMQYYGSIAGWVQIALDNDLSLTDALEPEQIVMLRDEMILDRQVVTFYAQNETIVATDNQ